MKKKNLQKNTLLPEVILNRRNIYILFAGTVVIAIGYFLLSIPPWDNPLSRSIAPLVLIVGYLGIIPYAIFYGSKKSDDPGDS